MSTGIIWREPESNKKGRVNKRRAWLTQLEEELKSHPDQWALISETQKSSTINPRFRGPDFERAYRIVSVDGARTFRIYCRYIGANA